MRKLFIECGSYNTAKRRAPWAQVIMKVTAGDIAFENFDDYMTAKMKK